MKIKKNRVYYDLRTAQRKNVEFTSQLTTQLPYAHIILKDVLVGGCCVAESRRGMLVYSHICGAHALSLTHSSLMHDE